MLEAGGDASHWVTNKGVERLSWFNQAFHWGRNRQWRTWRSEGKRHPFVTKDNKLRLPELLKGQISMEAERGDDAGFAGQIANMGKMFFEARTGPERICSTAA